VLYGLPDYSQPSDGQNADCGLLQLIQHTNLDIQDTACLNVVHVLQHPTSHPTTKSTQHTKVNARKKSLAPHPAGKYGKSTMRST